MRKTLTLLLAAGALGAAVSACGSSRAAGVIQVPQDGATAVASAVSEGRLVMTADAAFAA